MLRRLLNLLLITGIGLLVSHTVAAKITFESVKTESVELTGKIVGRYFLVEFSVLPYVDPAAFGYFISAFQNQQIPYDDQHQPVASVDVTCTMSFCSYALEAPITSTAYIVGIGSSHSVNTISATLSLTPGSEDGTAFTPLVSVLELGINTVIVQYEMPSGYSPADSKAWVGIWQGQMNGTIPPPIGKANINSYQSDGSQAINGLNIQVETTYTIGLFSGPNDVDIVASTTIETKTY